MKVLWLKPTQPPTLSIGRVRLAEQLRKMGHRVTVGQVSGLGFFWGLARYALADFDVIIGTTKSGAILGMVLKALRGKRFVVDHVDPMFKYRKAHPGVRSAVVSFLEGMAIRSGDHVMVTYPDELKRVRKMNPSVTEAPLGVEYTKFRRPANSAVEKARKVLVESGVDTKKKIVMYVGGFTKPYRLDVLVKAMTHLPKQVQLVFVGGGKQEKRIMRLAAGKKNIFFLGMQPSELVPGFLHEADVCVTLNNDAHQVKVLEYAAAGKKVVAAKGRLEERFPKGLFYSGVSPKPVASTIRKALAAKAGARLDVRKYDYARIAEKYARVTK